MYILLFLLELIQLYGFLLIGLHSFSIFTKKVQIPLLNYLNEFLYLPNPTFKLYKILLKENTNNYTNDHDETSDGEDETSDGEEYETSDGEEYETSDGEDETSDGEEHETSDGDHNETSDGEENETSDGEEHETSDGGDHETSDGDNKLSDKKKLVNNKPILKHDPYSETDDDMPDLIDDEDNPVVKSNSETETDTDDDMPDLIDDEDIMVSSIREKLNENNLPILKHDSDSDDEENTKDFKNKLLKIHSGIILMDEKLD